MDELFEWRVLTYDCGLALGFHSLSSSSSDMLDLVKEGGDVEGFEV